MQSPHTPENWSAASAAYDLNFADFTGQYAESLLERADLHPEQSVVELAAGTGALTLRLAPRVGQLLSTDYSEGMLARLQPKLERAALTNVTLRQMNGMAMDLKDAEFDRALCQFGIMLFDDPSAGMREMCRVLKPGGRAVLSGWAGPDRFETFGVFTRAIAIGAPDLPKPTARAPIFVLSEPSEFEGMLIDAGFQSAKVDFVTHRFQPPSIDRFLEIFQVSAPPARQLFAAVGPEVTARILAAMRSILEERFGDGPISLANTATVGVAVR